MYLTTVEVGPRVPVCWFGSLFWVLVDRVEVCDGGRRWCRAGGSIRAVRLGSVARLPRDALRGALGRGARDVQDVRASHGQYRDEAVRRLLGVGAPSGQLPARRWREDLRLRSRDAQAVRA